MARQPKASVTDSTSWRKSQQSCKAFELGREYRFAAFVRFRSNAGARDIFDGIYITWLILDPCLESSTSTMSADVQAHGDKVMEQSQYPQDNGNNSNTTGLLVPKDDSQSKTRRPSGTQRTCGKCQLSISGQFVRALDNTWHLDCFTCHVSIFPGMQ